MPNLKNLVPFTSDQSREEAKKNGAAGGRASGESRRRKRSMREALDELLELPLRKGVIKELQSLADLAGPNGKINLLNGKVNVTVEQAVLLAQILQAINGNTKAATFLRDTAGQKILKDADEQTEYEDDGFTEAIKNSAKDVWK